MKKVLFSLLGILLFIGTTQAQDDAVKLSKSAGKALAAYNQDPAGNGSKLVEAKTKIDQALQTAEAQALASAWIIKGDVYSTRIQNEMAMQQVNPNAKLTGDNDALDAFNAYKTAYEKPEAKKYEKEQAIDGIVIVQSLMINVGVGKYNNKEFEKAFFAFKGSLEAHEILKASKKTSVLDDPKEYTDQIFFTGLLASLAKRCTDAVFYYEMLYNKGTDSVGVYEGLYSCKLELKDEAGALKVLQEGRKKFPEESSLLFAEINYYISKGRLNELTGSLEQAIKKEPGNASLYRALGDVYNNLFTAMLEDSTQTKEQKGPKMSEYACLAKRNFKTAVAKEPNNLDFNYSLGALLYNETNLIAQDMNATSFSTAAGQKRYQELKVEMLKGVDEAIKYFQKAESLDANDASILAALIQAYSRKEEDALYLEFKKRLDVVKKGGTNVGSYFKNIDVLTIEDKNGESVQCSGITQEGKRCLNSTTNCNGKCHLHD
ncbi:MAG: tetratricopeptide repeat protein [Saprospiraceae bacterium]